MFGDVDSGQVEQVGRHRVGFRDRDDPVAHTQQVEDAEVLLALGHPPVAAGDDEQRDVDRAHAGEHVLHEPLMTGDVDEPDLDTRRQGGEREAEIDGESPCLLLREPVGIGTSEREHER